MGFLSDGRPCPRGDRLATTVWKILSEGQEHGWVSGLPPDAAIRLDAAVNEYCAPEQEDVSVERRES